MKGGDRLGDQPGFLMETYVSQFAARWVSAQFHVDRRQVTGRSKERRVRWGPKARPKAAGSHGRDLRTKTGRPGGRWHRHAVLIYWCPVCARGSACMSCIGLFGT